MRRRGRRLGGREGFHVFCKSARLLPARLLLPPTSCDRIQECQQVDRPSSSVCSPSVCPSLLVFGCPSVRLSCVVLRSGCRSLEVSVFQVPVLKREAFLLPLAPFFIVKVNVCSLKKGLIRDKVRQTDRRPRCRVIKPAAGKSFRATPSMLCVRGRETFWTFGRSNSFSRSTLGTDCQLLPTLGLRRVKGTVHPRIKCVV